MKRLNFVLTLGLALVLMTACQKEEELIMPTPSGALNNNITGPTGTLRPWGDMWVGCKLFNMVTSAQTINPEGRFNELYLSSNAFKNQVMGIAEAMPGDANYMDGRWHINKLKPSVNADKYKEACSISDITKEDFESTPIYFAYPLLPGLTIRSKEPVSPVLEQLPANRITQARQ